MFQHGCFANLPCASNKDNLEKVIELQEFSLKLPCDICHTRLLVFRKIYGQSYFIVVFLLRQENMRMMDFDVPVNIREVYSGRKFISAAGKIPHQN